MAEAVVGGAFLSAFVNVLFDRLFSSEFINLIRGKKLDHKLLERLETTLYAVQAVLNDAERKQINDPAVKKWLDKLQNAFYVADDLLDKVFTEAAIQKEVSNFLSRFLNLRDRKVVKEIEDITSRLEYVVQSKNTLGLEKIPNENFSWRNQETSVENGGIYGGGIYGRENDQDAIIKILNDSGEDKISVIPIVGMGGVGKTTLARWVYNNDKYHLMKGFDLKAWVCVSEEFDIVEITRTIIRGITSGVCDTKDFNLLQLDLKEKLSRKKFFVVLDDVWSEDYNGWNRLIKPFQYGANGSKILVTTRSEKVASVVQTCPPYHLNQLSDEHCWSVFAEHARFPESNWNSPLGGIGREIVKKCNGLPLAAQTLGGLLRAKHDIKDWNAILTSDTWELPANDSKIIPALRISYYHLTPHLKRCFAYCSLYPEDYEFQKDELILLWMAEDLLRPPRRGERLEDVGSECFDDLASRSFFKQHGTHSNLFVMHDLMHDLAISVAGDFYFRSEELGNASDVNIHTRHLSYRGLSYPISKNFDAINKLKSLRTFLQINFSDPSFSFESAASIILSKFKWLRVLSFFECWELEVIPDSIGELVHLRYLDLSQTSIKTLPESLSNLYNLQTLRLYDCQELTMLPSGMQNLVNLRHLDIKGTHLKEMPPGMSKLKDLQLLTDFVVGKHEENGIKELGELSDLHGSLAISKLENVTNSGEAGEAQIMDKTHIEDLLLEWSSGVDMFTTSTHIEREILDKLQPHKSLKVLTIKRYRSTRFPDWVGHSSYHNMTRVSLESCGNCCMLPSLGQLPSLKILEIKDFSGVETIGAEFYKNDNDHCPLRTPFPSLEDLSFRRMPCWKVWHSSESDAFPQLKRLIIDDCPMLEGGLPSPLPALEELEIDGCMELVSPLPRAPMIRELKISRSDKVELQELPISLQSLSISGSDKVELRELPISLQSLSISGDKVELRELPISLQRLSITGSEQVESMFEAITITQPTCLQSLDISNCSSAISFPRDCLPESLKSLRIRNCGKLEFPKQQHELLESLRIEESCDSLTSFPSVAFPNLQSMEFRRCENLESLSVSQSQVLAVGHLSIIGCPNFVRFPREGLAAPNLTSFYLSHCNKLKSLPNHMNTLLPKLDYLGISDSPEIDSFPEGGLPPNLRSLYIFKCEKLLGALSSMGAHEGLTFLYIVDGGSLESFKSFPKEGLLPQLPSLTYLLLEGLETTETLECKGILHLTSPSSFRNCILPQAEQYGGRKAASLSNKTPNL